MAASVTDTLGPQPEDCYNGDRIPFNEWFDKFEAHKSARASRRIADGMWFTLLRDYFQGHVGLSNALDQVPVAQRNNLANLRTALYGILFPDGQPQIATKAAEDWHAGRGLPHPSFPMAVLEESRRLLRRMAPDTLPNDADQVRHLIRHVSPEYANRLAARSPADLDAAARVLRETATLAATGSYNPSQLPQPFSVPIFGAMGGGDPSGNRVPPPPSAPMVEQTSVMPPTPAITVNTGAMMDQVKAMLSESIKDLQNSIQAHLQSSLQAQSAKQEQRMDAVAASINAIHVGAKRSGSPSCGNNYHDDREDQRLKRGKYGQRSDDGRHCRHCRSRGWSKANTHYSDDCFQHPNPNIARRNWDAYAARTGIRDDNRRRSYNTDRNGDRHGTGGGGGRAPSRMSDAELQAMIDQEANKRVQEMKDKAEQDFRNQKIDELHANLLRRDRDKDNHST